MAADPYDHPDVAAIIEFALREDLRFAGDLTCQALVGADARLSGVVRAKSSGVVCGLSLFGHVFAALGGRVAVTAATADGTAVETGDVVAQFHGDASVMLQGERTALNLCQRLSGTATLTRRFVQAVAGTRAKILDTRKTSPGMRVLQKHAVIAGGGHNHRAGLHDQVLIKENHIALMAPSQHARGPAEAVRRCRATLGELVTIEVEIEDLIDLEPVIAAGANIVLLDNMEPPALARAVAARGKRAVLLEASGGITLDNVRAYADTGVDRISVGALTHSVAALDLSMRCTPLTT